MRGIFGATLASHNPFALYEYGGLDGFDDTTGRTSVSAPIAGGEDTGVFIAAGQSQIGNHVSGALYTPSSPLVHNLDVYGGGCWRYAEPILGASGGGSCYLGALGDALIAAGTFERVIFLNPSIGSTRSADWAPTGLYHHRLLASIRRAWANGYPISGILWDNGTTDHAASTAQATIEANLRAMINGTRGLGYTGPWFLSYDTILADVQSATVRAAIAAVAASETDVELGPDLDVFIGATDRPDGLHFDAASRAAVAGAWEDVLTPYFA